MIVKLEKENGTSKELIISTLPARLNEIKGDIKTRNEIIREVVHNSIAENANRIDIEIRNRNVSKVDIVINCYGEKLNVFSNVENIIRAIIEADISKKRNDDTIIGGKGRGAKVLLSADKLIIESRANGKIDKISIDGPNNQIERLFKDNSLKENEDKFIVNVIHDRDDIDDMERSIKYNIEGVDTNNIKYFEHDSLVKYLRYFTILVGMKNNKKIPKNLEVNVQGLLSKNEKKGLIEYITKPNKEILLVGSAFDRLKEYAVNNNCKFSVINCSNGKIECLNGDLRNKDLLNNRINDSEIKILKEFFMEDECYIFRSTDKKLKKEMKLNKDDKDSEFFGIYGASEGVMINERFEGLSKLNASKAGGNLFAQYFGYINTSKIRATGDRNRIEGSNEFFNYKKELSEKIMPLINSILSFNEQDENSTSNVGKSDNPGKDKNSGDNSTTDKSGNPGKDKNSGDNNTTGKSSNPRKDKNSGDNSTTDKSDNLGKDKNSGNNSTPGGNISKNEIIELIENKDIRIIQGLWAELKHISEQPNLINGWVAYQRGNIRKRPHDFEYNKTFDEIKSKVVDKNTNQDIINITSINQLDDERVGNLYVYYLQCNAPSSEVGIDILDMIKEVSEKIGANQKDNLFKGIGNYLLIDNFKEMFCSTDFTKFTYNLDKFEVQKIHRYIVDSNFPCLRAKVLNEACASLNDYGYKLDLSLVKRKVKPIEVY